jgi:hypothetical protein
MPIHSEHCRLTNSFPHVARPLLLRYMLLLTRQLKHNALNAQMLLLLPPDILCAYKFEGARCKESCIYTVYPTRIPRSPHPLTMYCAHALLNCIWGLHQSLHWHAGASWVGHWIRCGSSGALAHLLRGDETETSFPSLWPWTSSAPSHVLFFCLSSLVHYLFSGHRWECHVQLINVLHSDPNMLSPTMHPPHTVHVHHREVYPRPWLEVDDNIYFLPLCTNSNDL